MDNLFSEDGNPSPFTTLETMINRGTLDKKLKKARTGQYHRVGAALRGVAEAAQRIDPDPGTWSIQDLEGIPGVGPKTARWFYLVVHPGARVAAIDTHVLKFLRDQGVEAADRKGTPPPGPVYIELEERFVHLADRLDIRPAELDRFVWAIYRNNGRILLGDKGKV